MQPSWVHVRVLTISDVADLRCLLWMANVRRHSLGCAFSGLCGLRVFWLPRVAITINGLRGQRDARAFAGFRGLHVRRAARTSKGCMHVYWVPRDASAVIGVRGLNACLLVSDVAQGCMHVYWFPRAAHAYRFTRVAREGCIGPEPRRMVMFVCMLYVFCLFSMHVEHASIIPPKCT